ncbi:MAG: signal peptidase I [Thermosynechococcaceae cyanobacterium]
MSDHLFKPALFAVTLLALTGCRGILPYESRSIPSGDMEPELQINDLLWIDRASYMTSKPVRGDIIVFEPTTTLQEQGFTDAFIKRIVGLPGETIAFKDGQVYINNSPLPEAYVSDNSPTDVEICEEAGSPPSPFKVPTEIPPDSYFTLGDNRLNSYDSRCWGFVTKADIIGRAVYRYLPSERTGGIERVQY